MIDFQFVVPLVPRGKGRPRFSRKTGACYTPASTRTWEASLAMMARASMPSKVIEEPLRVDILAVLPRPKRLLRKSDPSGLIWAPVKPDCDNLTKSLLDSLKPFWRDDSIVVDCTVLKAFAERTGQPRMQVRIRSAGDLEIATAATFEREAA